MATVFSVVEMRRAGTSMQIINKTDSIAALRLGCGFTVCFYCTALFTYIDSLVCDEVTKSYVIKDLMIMAVSLEQRIRTG